MHELQPWHKSVAEVKARTMYVSYSISVTYIVEFALRIHVKQTFILTEFFSSHIGTDFSLVVLSCCLCSVEKHRAHILGGAGKPVAKIRVTLHLLQLEKLTNEARSATVRCRQCVDTGYLSPLLCWTVIHNMPRLSVVLSPGYSQKQSKEEERSVVFKPNFFLWSFGLTCSH